MTRRKLGLMVALSISLETRGLADPYVPKPDEILHLKSGLEGRTPGGVDLRLPPGYFLDEAKYRRDEVELKRLQDAETRLTAENASFRESAKAWSPPFWLLGTAFAVGAATGVYVVLKLK